MSAVGTFVPFPKIKRATLGVTVTEKVDGSNAAVVFDEGGELHAQSRNRIITPDDDNFGFAKFVTDNADTMYDALGPGTHFGEWYGQGIQRSYGMDHRRFALFNVGRWADVELPPCLSLVPTLYVGPMDTALIDELADDLQANGSRVAGSVPGWSSEGLMIYMHAAGAYIKMPFEEAHKGQSAGAA